jgi:enoyl-CoA hydratase/carnithine racemase
VLRELTYSHREFTGDEAQTLGFATWVDPDPLARALTLAGEIAQRSPDAVRAAKALANRAPDLTEDQILLAESEADQRLIRSPNQREAMAAGMERRTAVFADPEPD